MENSNKNHPKVELTKEEKREQEQKIDEQLEQSFPASDPPSYSQPGNDGIKPSRGDNEAESESEEKDDPWSDRTNLGGDQSSVSDTGLGSMDERNEKGGDAGDQNIGGN